MTTDDEKALSDYLALHQNEPPSASVLETFGLSMQEFHELYKNLAN